MTMHMSDEAIVNVKVTAEKKKYADYGVHIGMNGWICDERSLEGYWLVNFPQCGEKPDIATLAIHEDDLKKIEVMDAAVNERISRRYPSPKYNGN